MKKQLLYAGALGSLLLGLGGCDFLQGFTMNKKGAAATESLNDTSNADDPVVVRVDGKPEMTRSEVMEFGDQAIQANPYLAQFGVTSFATAPAQIREQIIDLLVQQKLIARWGTETGVDRTDEFNKEFNKLVKHLRAGLIAQNFDKRLLDTVVVSDAEIRDEYEKAREHFVVNPGFVTAVGASFDDEEKARVFFGLVSEGKEGTFKELAEESDVDVVSFGKVSLDLRGEDKGSDVSLSIRQALAHMDEKDFFAQAQDGDTYWVLQVTDRSGRSYAPIEQVWGQLERGVKGAKFRDVRAARVEELRKMYTVDVDSEALGQNEDPMALLQQMLAAQGQDPNALAAMMQAAQEDAEQEEGDDTPAAPVTSA